MSTSATHSSHRSHRRGAALALLGPLTAAGVLLGAAPASAVPFEGEPTGNQCLRLVQLPDAGPTGGPLFVLHRYALFLRSGAECSSN